MRKYLQRKVWNVVLTCRKCRKQGELHLNAKSLRKAKEALRGENFNGWDTRFPGRELCPFCWLGGVQLDVKRPVKKLSN